MKVSCSLTMHRHFFGRRFFKTINHLFGFLFYLVSASAISQTQSSVYLDFDFNNHHIRENNNKIQIKPVGVTLTADRFGNENSAIFIHGHASSYLNLGPSRLLKPVCGTWSMWFNLQEISFAGKGYNSNPLITLRNGPGEDYIHAFATSYNLRMKRISTQTTCDSTLEVIISAKDSVVLNRWYHLVTTYDNDHLSFYIDGVLQGKFKKGFVSVFSDDSVVIGSTTGPKNQRYTFGIFDDIRLYHRVLNEKEILDLYRAPNPNKFKHLLVAIIQGAGVLTLLGLIVVLLLIRNKKNLKRQKEYYELNNKITDLELKVIRAQMNPHFISNNLSAIQSLIYQKDFEKAAQYIAKFSFFLREVLDYSDKTYTTLEEEVSIIKLNVELEQMRFRNNFHFDVQVAKNIRLKDIIIPSLVTQPFIENAIWHGLLPLEDREPWLEIKIYIQNKIIYLEIEDNGVGRSIEGSPDKNSKGTNLALDKIESINRLRNSVDYKLNIVDLYAEDGKPRGTKIIIELAIETLEE